MAPPRFLNIQPVISNEVHFSQVSISQKERASCLGPVAFVWLIFPLECRLEPLKLVKMGLAFPPSFSAVRRSSQRVIYPSSRLELVAAVVLVSTVFPAVLFHLGWRLAHPYVETILV